MAFTIADIQENELSWSVSSPKTAVSDLLQLNTLDSAGDLAYIEQNGRAYVYDVSADSLVLIKEKWGTSSSDQAAFRGWEDWGYGSRKLRAVEAKSGGGWVVALEDVWDNQSNWQVFEIDSSGYIDWDNAYWGDIKSKEYLFEVSGSALSGDLNQDGVIGINLTGLTTSSEDSDGATILSDSDGYAYIKVSSASDAQIIAITDNYGGTVRFNQSWSWEGGSSTEIATHAQLISGSPDVYQVIVKQTETYGSTTDIRHHVHTVSTDGTFDWNSQWDVDLISYEAAFGEDFNGDGVTGFNSARLNDVTTDDDAASSPASDAVFLQRDQDTGSIYIFDNSFSAESDKRIKINDSYLETNETWDGGSHTCVVVAAEKNSFQLDGESPSAYHYIVALKGTDTYSASDGISGSSTYWDILPVESDGTPRWEYQSYTDSIAGYEDLFGQDLDGVNGQGIAVGNLTAVTTDETDDGVQMHLADSGAIFISDVAVNSGEKFALKDRSGGTPAVALSETWQGGGFEIIPYASVKRTESSTDYYYGVFKNVETWGTGDEDKNISYTIFKTDANGVIDFENSIETKSITTYEGSSWFGQDINGDGNSTGSVSVTDKPAILVNGVSVQDASGDEKLGKDSEGALYIRDASLTSDGEDVRINESWIEESHSWDQGSHSSMAFAVREVGNAAASSGYYQVAVKNSNTWTDWSSGQTQSDEGWQLYAFDLSGTEGNYQLTINWEKTIWTQSISNYESDFGVDLDGSGGTGDIPGLALASTDTNGARLKKDTQKVLYIVDDESDTSPLMITDDYGGSMTFDYEYNWGSGSSSSSAIAIDLNSDNSFSLLVKHTNTQGTESNTDWEIIKVGSDGKIDWNETIWTSDIAAYEVQFGEDLDNSGSTGFSLDSSVWKTSATGFDSGSGPADLSGVVLKANSSTLSNDSVFYITTSGGDILPLNEDWGGSAQLKQSYTWTEGSWSSEPVAIKGGQSYTNWAGSNETNGYAIALKNTDIYDGNTNTSWDIVYANSKGVINGNRVFTNSISNFEQTFLVDLNEDGALGQNTSAITSTDNKVTTDVVGDELYLYQGSLYFSDSDDNSIHQIIDQWGGSPSFNWSDSGGSGDTAWSYSQNAYAIESTGTGASKKFLLAVKNSNSWGGGTAETSWETFEIKKNSSTNVWELDWDTSSFSKGIARKESDFGQDLNGVNGLESSSSITTTVVDTDTSRGGGLTGVTLTKDSEGSFYIQKQDGSNLAIVDDAGMSASFDWKQSFGQEIVEAKAFAVEGVLDSNNALDHYKIAIKHTTEDKSTTPATTNVQFETFKVSSTGLIDWGSGTFGDPQRHEASLNQDLSGDNKIWSTSLVTFTAAGSDVTDSRAYLDADGNVYIQPNNSRVKNPVLDFGGLVSFNYTSTFADGSGSFVESVEGVELVDDAYYQLLIKEVETYGSTSSTYYSTVNIDPTTYEIDWGSFAWYENPASLESTFSIGTLDGVAGIAEINSTATSYVSTDTTGAKLKRTSDGSLFIEDNDEVTAITGANGGYVDLDFTETWDGGSFKSESLAVQKDGDNYLLAVKETLTHGSNTDISYQVLTLKDTTPSNGETNHVLSWGDAQFFVAADLNESKFGQDLTDDGQISQQSSSSTYADEVKDKATDGEALSLIGQQAQSDVKAINNPKAGATDSQIEMFTGGVEGTSKSNYELDVSVVQQPTTALLAKVAADAAVAGGTGSIEALTPVMDFSVTISNTDNYGKVVSMAWILPEGTTNPVYMKKDAATGEYFDFKFDDRTKQGYKWDATSRTLKVYVKDNGRYDSDPTLGKVRDPGLITEVASSSTPSPSPSPSSSPTPTPIPTSIPSTDDLLGDVAVLNANDISALTPDAISDLSADQLSDLPAAAMQGFSADQLSELSDDAVAVFTPKQIKQLPAEAIKGLSAGQVSELSPKAVKGFSSDQIEQLSKRTFKGLETKQLAKLSKDAVTGLTTKQLKTLSGDELSVFKPQKIKSIDADAISGLKPDALDALSQRQVKAFTDDQLGGLSKKQIKKADDFVDALSDQQREALSFDPGRSSRLVDPLSDQDDLSLLPGLDPLA